MDPAYFDPARPTLFFDTECYRNYWLIMFLATDGKVAYYEQFPGQPINRKAVNHLFKHYRLVSFNGNMYDMVTVTAAMAGYPCDAIKKVSDAIIIGQAKPWEFEQLNIPRDVDHIDLIEPAFGDGSLKIYGGRCHSRKLQDLPIDPDAEITPEQRPVLRSYCTNDLETTRDLFTMLKADLELRDRMSVRYGIDLRSKSDAQMAEAILRNRVSERLGTRVERPIINPGTTFHYRVPDFVRFALPECRYALAQVMAAEFHVKPNGRPWVPAWGAEDDEGHVRGAPQVLIGAATYRMGYGGLHSSEKCVSLYADDEHTLEEEDVASYYPKIIQNLRLAPKHMGDPFREEYSDIIVTRLKAKEDGDKETSQTLKILLNGSFGKFGSKWSTLYAPDLMIQTTLTGQLALLMLIEALERSGITVASANTDGIVVRCHRSMTERKRYVCHRWSQVTGFTTETTPYRAIFSRDVNSYLALKQSGGFKGKGAFNDGTTVEARLSKNPTNVICIDAVRAFLEHGTPIAHTIRNCRDVRKFVTVRAVKGTGVWNGQVLGKVVRWYYAEKGGASIHYATTGNKVARTDGCMPLMTLPDELPGDVDYLWYIKEALSILNVIGYS